MKWIQDAKSVLDDLRFIQEYLYYTKQSPTSKQELGHINCIVPNLLQRFKIIMTVSYGHWHFQTESIVQKCIVLIFLNIEDKCI